MVYTTSIEHDSWQVPTDPEQPDIAITCGTWTKTTVDRPLGSRSDGPFLHYPYRPLHSGQHIRLLVLYPGDADDILRGSLIEASSILTDNEEIVGFDKSFEAISYTWSYDYPGITSGNGGLASAKIVIDGYSCHITYSAAAALYHIRSPHQKRTLWIDQLCINQNDNEERSYQVAIMYQIYAVADRVLAWLGPAGKNTVVGMQGLAYLCRAPADNQTPLWETLPPDLLRDGIVEILNRSWFTRSWIVQEAAVAQHVRLICGPDSIEWPNTLERVSHMIFTLKLAVVKPDWAANGLDEANTDFFVKLLEMQRQAGPQKNLYIHRPPTMLDTMYDLRHRGCVDARDKIFSVLSLAPEEVRKRLQPNYLKTVQETYEEFERVLLDVIEGGLPPDEMCSTDHVTGPEPKSIEALTGTEAFPGLQPLCVDNIDEDEDWAFDDFVATDRGSCTSSDSLDVPTKRETIGQYPSQLLEMANFLPVISSLQRWLKGGS